jgi:hypothetical protein
MSDKPHPADADYTAFHVLSDDQVDEMVDSAFAVANLLTEGRRFRPIDREPPIISIDDGFDPPMIAVHPDLPNGVVLVNGQEMRFAPAPPVIREYGQLLAPREAVSEVTETLFEEAKAKAVLDRVKVSAADELMIDQARSVIDEWARRLRELPCAKEPVIHHALNSLDLARLGLAKVVVDDRENGS